MLATSAGCSPSPIVGDWESEKKAFNGESHELTINDDLSGSGHFWVDEDGGFKCKFDLEAEEIGERRYEVRVTGRGECDFRQRVDCDISSDERDLTCEIDDDDIVFVRM